MEKTKEQFPLKKWILRAILLIYDVTAVNLAYFLALVIRFYVNNQFHWDGVTYIANYVTFAPYYTVVCIIVFILFRLYDGMWRYAGIRDFNRILNANIITCLIHIFGTLLFVRRMPITYYGIGAVLQLVMIAISRFLYVIFVTEYFQIKGNKARNGMNTMVIGAGESARSFLKMQASNKDSILNPVCVVDCHNNETGRLFNGLPVIGGTAGIQKAISKYEVQYVVIADAFISKEEKDKVKTICSEMNLPEQDFLTYTKSFIAGLSMSELMKYTKGPVEVVIDQKSRLFDNGEQAFDSLKGNWTVKSIGTANDHLVVEIESSSSALSSEEPWIKEYEKETGEEISFF